MPDDTPQPAKVAPVASESDPAVPDETSLDASTSTALPAASVARTNSLSKMRSHRGNVPTLPQTKLCPLCPAKFTRTTHLNRHLKTHSNERMHGCDRCHAQFTRSDLLTRHRRTCCDSSANRSRRKSCQSCADSKVKCDLQKPCSKCKARGRECVYLSLATRNGRGKVRDHDSASGSSASPPQDSPTDPDASKKSSTDTTPSTDFVIPASVIDSISPETAATSNSSSPLNGAFSNDTNIVAVVSPSHNEEERGYFTELFSSQMYDNLFTDLFTSSFDKNPSVPGQHFQQDPTAVITDRLESTAIDHAMLGTFVDPSTPTGPSQLAMYIMPSVPLPFNPMTSIPEHELLEAVNGPASTVQLRGLPSIAEYYEYITNFLTTFSQHMPIVHLPTFLKDSRHPLLVKATKACGAMYANTSAAKHFIERAMATSRDEIIAELSNTTDFDSMTHLALASGLFQTIGMFHKDPEQRAKSNVYHGMIVMMLRMNGFMEQTREFKIPPFDFADPQSVDKAWRDWVRFETAKRAIWILFTHDCSHAVFFNLQPTFHNEQFTTPLPCEDGLWKASNSVEWALILQTPSRYGSAEIRLSGQYLKTMYNYLVQDNPTNESREFNVPPFAHFLMIHAVMRKLFELYLRDRLPFQQGTNTGVARPRMNPHYVDKVRVFHVQILLHCWLQSWLSSPDTPRDVPESQQRFCFNALPLYWLTQVGLVAYQEGLPPFDPDGTYISSHEAKFTLLKKWEAHIRRFLEDGSQTTTVFWDEVMKIRTDSWTAESGFEYQHLLGFFLQP